MLASRQLNSMAAKYVSRMQVPDLVNRMETIVHAVHPGRGTGRLPGTGLATAIDALTIVVDDIIKNKNHLVSYANSLEEVKAKRNSVGNLILTTHEIARQFFLD